MVIHLVAIALLVLVFLIGTTRNINLGALALVAGGILLIQVTGVGLDALYTAFPADLFLLLLGVTFLFGIASVNGTLTWVVDALGRAVGGRASLMPWVLFFVGAVATSIGALAPAVVALVAPIGMELARKYRIDPKLVGLMILHGAACGNFSPVNLLGATVNQVLERAGLQSEPTILFIANFGYNLVLGVVIYVTFGGLKIAAAERRSRRDGHRTGEQSTAIGGVGRGGAPLVREKVVATGVNVSTLLIIVAVGALALIGGVDIGMLALAAAVLLRIVTPKSSAGGEKKIAWEVILLIGGVVTYVGILQEIGTIDFVGTAANDLGMPFVTALIICAIAAIVSAFASSAGMIAALIPLSIPFLASGDVSVIGMVAALSISATVVDSAPFSTIGALVLSNTHQEDRQRMYRGELVWGGIMVVSAPIITTVVFVLPSIIGGAGA